MVYNKKRTNRKNNHKTKIHAYFNKITLFRGFIIVMPKIMYMCAGNPDTRVKSDILWNLEYYSGILCKKYPQSENIHPECSLRLLWM